MNYQEAVAWVHSLPRLAQRPGIENTRRLLEMVGNPQKSLRFVHIAGTNGKGSVTTMLASVCKAAGLRTGANISPYVLEFRERFQLNGAMIPPNTLADLLTQVRQGAETLSAQGWDIVEFDAVTVTALLWYAKEHCDLVCLEVGLGGRLDSTNAIENTLVACILSIGMDHTELLGNTLAQIAAEKCGILKQGCTVIGFPAQHAEAADVIAKAAHALGCPLCVPPLTSIEALPSPPLESHMRYKDYLLRVPFLGQHQQYNAAVVVEAALALRAKGFAISQEAIVQGIAAASFPARIEVLSKAPFTILDGAHNPDGARALAQTLQGENLQNLAVVMGVLQGKGAPEMLAALAPHIGALFAVAPHNPRALDAQALERLGTASGIPTQSYADIATAIAAAKKHPSSKNGLLVCGSLYLAAQARPLLLAH